MNLYDKYKGKFKKLINNEITFMEIETGEEYWTDDGNGLIWMIILV